MRQCRHRVGSMVGGGNKGAPIVVRAQNFGCCRPGCGLAGARNGAGAGGAGTKKKERRPLLGRGSWKIDDGWQLSDGKIVRKKRVIKRGVRGCGVAATGQVGRSARAAKQGRWVNLQRSAVVRQAGSQRERGASIAAELYNSPLTFLGCTEHP